jgi:uncharacterized membrane protein
MKPLIVLISAFLLTSLYTYAFNQGVNIDLSGRLALAVMLLFTAIAHFVFIKGMVMMVPSFIPYQAKRMVVYITGIIEVLAAVAIMYRSTRVVAGYLLILFFIALLPANIHTARQRINMEKASHSGPGLKYLWFRIPLQLFLICWTYFFTIVHPY